MTEFQPAFTAEEVGAVASVITHEVVTTKEKVEKNMKVAKEAVVKQVGTVGEFVKAKYVSVKESRFSKWVNKAYTSTIGFLGGKKTAIAVGSVSVVAGGIVTVGTLAAVAVGTALAVAVVGASHAMQKKKEEKLSYKAMLTDMGVATGTVVAMPFVLLTLAYVGVYATTFGAILPYAIIVA